MVPLDLVKCRLQVDPDKYKNVLNGFKVSMREEGVRGLAKGWAPTFFGYSAQVSYFHTKMLIFFFIIPLYKIFVHQGMCKFGLYEVFKVQYAGMISEETAYTYRTILYLAASASAEFFADIALSPMEAAKVKKLILWFIYF